MLCCSPAICEEKREKVLRCHIKQGPVLFLSKSPCRFVSYSEALDYRYNKHEAHVLTYVHIWNNHHVAHHDGGMLAEVTHIGRTVDLSIVHLTLNVLECTVVALDCPKSKPSRPQFLFYFYDFKITSIQ